MSTNDTPPADEPAKTDSEVAEELRLAKEAEASKVVAPEAPVIPDVVDPAEVVQPELTTTPLEPAKDLDWYIKAYEESTKEALRLKDLVDAKPAVPETPAVPPVIPSQAELYIKQKQDEEITEAFKEVAENYPQAKDPEDYKKFTAMATVLGKAIYDAEERFVPPKELYSKTVIALGWTADDNKDRLAAALKDGASAPRVASGGARPSTSKVTDQMIIANRKMYPGKTDAELREELEPHIQV